MFISFLVAVFSWHFSSAEVVAAGIAVAAAADEAVAAAADEAVGAVG